MQTIINPIKSGEQAKAILKRLQSQIPIADHNKFVLIDVESGDYEIGTDDVIMEENLLSRRPKALMVLLRADGGPTGHFGFSWSEEE